MGTLEEGSYTEDFERRMKDSRNETSVSEGALRGEPGGRTPLLGTPKDMLSKAVEMSVCFQRCPALGENGGTLFS